MTDIKHLKNFCALPFHHLYVKTEGNFLVCCKHADTDLYNIQENSAEEWLTSDYLQEVRESFLQDKQHPNCHACWRHENNGFSSMRNRSHMEYQIFGIDVDNPKVNVVEIAFGNTCNLKCLMCKEQNSSSILHENKILGVNQFEQHDFQWNDKAIDHVKEVLQLKPKLLNVRGGEPFYEKRLFKLLDEIPTQDAKKMILHISTNATIWNEKWEKMLKKFHLIRFMFSVDAIGEQYEYIRYPAEWKITSDNILKINAMPNTKCLVHTVVMNLNIMHLQPLIDWCAGNNLFLDMDTIQTPQFYRIDNLLPNAKATAIEHCESILAQKHYPTNVIDFVSSCKKTLVNSNNNITDTRWNDFLNYVTVRDRLRNKSYLTNIN